MPAGTQPLEREDSTDYGFTPDEAVVTSMHKRCLKRLAKYELVTAADAAEVGAPLPALDSLQRTLCTRKLKKDSRLFRERKRLKALVAASGDGEGIWSAAVSAGWSPYLLARAVVDAQCKTEGDRKKITALMRAPQSIPSPPLSRAVAEVVSRDPFVSPAVDAAKAEVGARYERHLERILEESGIHYVSEDSLRDLGAAKTPDVLLPVPLGVLHPVTGEALIVHWIDSKALFGDGETHAASVLPQTQSYVARYGPGLVVYWFGCEASLLAPGLGDGHVAAAPCFPTSYVLPASTDILTFARPAVQDAPPT